MDRAKPPEPPPKNWDWLDAIVGDLDEDFVAAALERPGPSDWPELGDSSTPLPSKDRS